MATTTKPETAGLLHRIKEGATNSQTPLGEVLRLCLRLGSLLDNKELSDWAKAEAGGYASAEGLPDYRICETEVHATFSGPFGSGINNASLPKSLINEGHQEALFTVCMTQPVGELERLAVSRDDDNSITIPWPGDMILYYQQKSQYRNMVLVGAWKVMTTTVVAGILEIIRTRVLEFVFVIEKEVGLDAVSYDDKKTPLEIPGQERIHQIFNMTIQNADNIAFGNSGTTNQQTNRVQLGDLKALKEKLSTLGVTEELITDLDTALGKDIDSTEQPGTHVQGWLSKVIIKAGQGTLQLVSASATVVVIAEVRRFLGLPPV